MYTARSHVVAAIAAALLGKVAIETLTTNQLHTAVERADDLLTLAEALETTAAPLGAAPDGAAPDGAATEDFESPAPSEDAPSEETLVPAEA